MNKIAFFRKQRKMTQVELATLIGVSQPAVALAERRGIKLYSIAKKYAAAFNCNDNSHKVSPADLLENITEIPQKHHENGTQIELSI